MPINTTRPSPPSRSAVLISGRAICSLFSPLANRRTGIAFFFAHRYTSATYASPILPNAADDGIENPFCQYKNWHTPPTHCSFGTYACKKMRSTDRQVSVT